jgi:hypothetical protein
LDIAAAILSWLLRDVAPERVLKGIASGLLGREAAGGGWEIAALGLLLHYSMMLLIVLVYLQASRLKPTLVQRPVIYGIAYGVAVYLVMNYGVLPLSAYPGGLPSLAGFLQGTAIHIVCVGLPISLLVRQRTPTTAPQPGG